MVHVPALPLQLQPLPHATNSTQSNRMRRQQAAPTATIQPSMPPSAPLVKPSRGGGLLSYIPTSISSILPARGCVDASAPSAPAPAPAPTEMSSPPGTTAKGGAAERAELSRVFQLLDRNGDGRITREELEDSLGKLGIPVPGDELAAMIARIDADGDGCVDEEEFGELYRAIMSTGGGGGGHEEKKGGAGGEEEEEEDMREAFRVFDANGDGYITVEELGAVLASLGLKQGRTPEECRRMIGQVDRDGDGRVDFHEFLQMMRGGGFAALG